MSRDDDEDVLAEPMTQVDLPAGLAVRELEPAPDPVLGTRFELGGEIGRGGMCSVRRAFDRGIRRHTAVKVLHPSLRAQMERFFAEAQITGQLEHPNIVPVHELGTDENGQHYFSMKLVEGETLEEALARAGDRRLAPGPLHGFLKIFVKVCEAVAYAHSRGVVHRDLKPSNVMIGAFGQVYVMDWGIARVMADRSDVDLGHRPPRPETPGVLIGTAHYMPPEQARGLHEQVDERSDVFSLGATLYHILTGRPPYQGRTHLAVAVLASQGAVQPPEVVVGRVVHPTLSRIAMKAMAPDPAHRYRSASELLHAVEAFLNGAWELPEQCFAAGTAIVVEGEPGETAYVVTSGACVVCRYEDGERRVLGALGPGDVFGETAVFSAKPRTATVEAVTDVTVMLVSREALTETLGLNTWMGTFVTALAERFRETNDRLRALERELARRPEGSGLPDS